MDSETQGTLDVLARALTDYSEGLRKLAEAQKDTTQAIEVLGRRLRALERRVGSLEEARPLTIEQRLSRTRRDLDEARSHQGLPVVPPVPARPSRGRVVREWVEVFLAEVCRVPYFFIGLAILIGLALAALQVECGR